LYPPTDGPVPAAAIRSRGLVRALRELDCEVTVVCGMPRGRQPLLLRDVTTISAPWLDLDSIAASISRDRGDPTAASIPGRSIATRMFPPDRYFTWIPGAAAIARRRLRERSIVLSTSAKSAHLVGRIVAGDRLWIADLNDPWTGNPHAPAGAIRRRADRVLERAGLGRATHITTVTEPLRAALAATYGETRVSTLMSGFYPSESPTAADPASRDEAVVLYVGTLYEKLDLSPIFAGLAEAKRAGTVSPRRVRFHFVGRLNERVLGESRRFGVEEFFTVGPTEPRPRVLEMMTTAGALLLPLYEDDPFSLPMKFFEYAGARRPIVALGPPDRLGAQIVRDHGLGFVVSTSIEARALFEQMDRDPSVLVAPAQEATAEFTWAATTERLGELLSRLQTP
jgi:glycosyltransferase involved in cell wall biosynthesis